MFLQTNITQIQKEFGIDLVTSSRMREAIDSWNNILESRPAWLDSDDDIDTRNMAEFICDYRARLTTLDIGVELSGSTRAEAMQPIVDDLIKTLREKLSRAEGVGGCIIRWNGKNWDFMYNGDFLVTATDSDGSITGVIFASYVVQHGARYTRLEYHRYEDGVYRISNRAYKNRYYQTAQSLGTKVPLTEVLDWQDLDPEVSIRNLAKPLFAYYRVPGANNIDDSPLGVSVFSNATNELRSMDIGISRKDSEVKDSKKITFVGQSIVKYADNQNIKLPRFVVGLGVSFEDGANKNVHEHNPTLQTENRIKDINFELSLLGVKCGFSEGVFVMDGKTGVITATQVESDDRDTIQSIKDDRDALKTAIDQALYVLDSMMTLYKMAPIGAYETTYNFGDITYNYEEDKASWRTYAMQGWVPKWLYLVKFEGMSEEDAKAFVKEAQEENRAPGLFE